MKNLKSIERDKWINGAEGRRLSEPVPAHLAGSYLHNRIEQAWCAGWDAALVNNAIILGALDTLGVSLAEHGHTWTDGERTIYEQAIAAVKQEPLRLG